jgi:hypothetical protein
MKKLVIFTILLFVVAAFAFANFTVTAVTNSVERVSGSQRTAVKVGDTLAADAVVNVAEGATLVLRAANGRAITVTGARNGTVTELTRAGVNIGGNVAQTNTNTITRTTVGSDTASARASDAAEGDAIDAE